MLPAASQHVLLECLEHLQQWLRDDILGPLSAAGIDTPAPLCALSDHLRAQGVHLASLPPDAPLDVLDRPLLKSALLRARRTRVEALERRAEACIDANTLESLDDERSAFDALIDSALFASAPERALPRLIDWLTAEGIERVRAPTAPPLRPRRYDATFHQLWSSALFFDDFRHFRDRCELRGTHLGVASLDLDGLRRINAAHGEQRVDRRLMPRLLAALESHFYGRGHAYGFGRDDFALLLPGADSPDGMRLLTRFQTLLTTLEYPGLDARPTVSIGLCTVSPGCVLTAREVMARVERARRFAKASGRDCVAVHHDGLHETAIEVVRATP